MKKIRKKSRNLAQNKILYVFQLVFIIKVFIHDDKERIKKVTNCCFFQLLIPMIYLGIRGANFIFHGGNFKFFFNGSTESAVVMRCVLYYFSILVKLIIFSQQLTFTPKKIDNQVSSIFGFLLVSDLQLATLISHPKI